MSSSPPQDGTQAQNPDRFHGWLGHDPTAASGNLTWSPFTPKPFAASDLDIKISHCGICASDIHTLRSGWGKTHYPICVGHEIVGHVARIGAGATSSGFKLGDRVGVGAQASSCLRDDCRECAAGLEQHCARMVGTYASRYPDGYWSMGGYAKFVRVPAHFVFKIPAALPSELAAPMLCAGLTMWSPLTKHNAASKRVGIVGLGGLGHFGLLFAKALGSPHIVAITRTRAKEADALALGANDVIATLEDKNWARRHARSLDLIVCTASSADMPLGGYMRMLRPGGQFVQVGAPEDKLPAVGAFALIGGGCTISGSQIGSPAEMRGMLAFAAEKKIRPWVRVRSMREAGRAVVDMEEGAARYRFVLVNEEVGKGEGGKARL